MPYVTPRTSFVICLFISSSTSYGNFTKSAVIASTDATTLIVMILPKFLASPSAPVARSSPTIANACHTRSYHPLCINSSSTIHDTSRYIRSFSSVTLLLLLSLCPYTDPLLALSILIRVYSALSEEIHTYLLRLLFKYL